MRALRSGYAWADARGLLQNVKPLVSVALLVAGVVAVASLTMSDSGPLSRGLVAPPVLLITFIYARRVAREYDGALLRWFFSALAVYSAFVFLDEEAGALQSILP